jgi:signal peptidase I
MVYKMNVCKIFSGIVIFVIIVLVGFGVWWMALALVSAVSVWLAYRAFLRRTRRGVAFVAVIFVFLIVLAVFLRVFVVEIYGVHTGSMMDTIVPGDYILVSKVAYGPVLPRSPLEIPLLNALFFNMCPTRDRTVPWWAGKRLAGFSDFQRGDIMICKSPESSGHLTKRCVALPGDTLQLQDGHIYINGAHQRDVPLVRKLHHLKPDRRYTFVLDSLHIYADAHGPDGQLMATLNEQEYQRVTGKKLDIPFPLKKDSVLPPPVPPPGERNLHWEMDNMAALVMPSRGMTVTLDSSCFSFYATLANNYEGGRLARRGRAFFLHGQQISSYTFQKDYFFMLGDNRHDSRDSRVWGAVPEEYIMGKAEVIFFSIRQRQPRMDRILRLIR